MGRTEEKKQRVKEFGNKVIERIGKRERLFGWLVFMQYQPFLGYLMPTPLYTYISNI